jgi:hypothetical protein
MSKKRKSQNGRGRLRRPSIPSEPPPRYQEFLTYLFDRPGHEEHGGEWYWDIDQPEFEASSTDIVRLCTHLFRNCGADLAHFSDAQIADGLTYVFSGDASNMIHALKDEEVHVDDRVTAIHAIETLYADCFSQRCSEDLGHVGEAKGKLNNLCYMLWDATSLGYYGPDPPADHPDLNSVIDVLEFVLSLKHDACTESALHGLSHVLKRSVAPRIHAIVDGFLREMRRSGELRAELITYARYARDGRVQ